MTRGGVAISASRPIVLLLFLGALQGGQPAMAALSHHQVAQCAPGQTPPFGTCGAKSPYTVQLQAGVSGNRPFPGPKKAGLSGWIEVLNTGPTMPHFVIDVRSSGSFAPGNVYAAFNTGKQKYRRIARVLGVKSTDFLWDFGAFPAGAVAVVHFRMHLKHGCAYQFNLQAYGNVTKRDSPDPATLAWNSGMDLDGHTC